MRIRQTENSQNSQNSKFSEFSISRGGEEMGIRQTEGTDFAILGYWML